MKFVLDTLNGQCELRQITGLSSLAGRVFEYDKLIKPYESLSIEALKKVPDGETILLYFSLEEGYYETIYTDAFGRRNKEYVHISKEGYRQKSLKEVIDEMREIWKRKRIEKLNKRRDKKYIKPNRVRKVRV